MKQILIIIPAFNHGGTNKSLQNILPLLDKNEYNIDVYTMCTYGPYKNLFSNCRLLSSNCIISAIMMPNNLSIPLYKKLPILIIKSVNKISKKFKLPIINLILKSTAWDLSRKKQYDTVVAFQEGYATHFGSYFVNIKNKIAWVRCDYTSYLNISKISPEQSIYDNYDKIICVSEYTKKTFIDTLPSLNDKALPIHNIINYTSIIELSNLNIPLDKRFSTEEFTIISIGRIDPIKRFSHIPFIAKKLHDSSCNFKWYIIGDGENNEEHKKLIENIDKVGIKDSVILLGEKVNPYPYLMKSHLLVCLSISEACPNVINEAKILHVPIVCSNFGSSSEFIKNNENGIICHIDNIAEAIRDMIFDKAKYNSIKSNIINFTYDNNKIMEEIEKIL